MLDHRLHTESDCRRAKSEMVSVVSLVDVVAILSLIVGTVVVGNVSE
ncbi:hypothetical protein ACFQJ7_09840 [Halovenus rubra]|uniref:Uncharacterized protein n=2 Tax=Halovenus rubra TaxID=869890 RepID=A0ABD5XD61_9EURY|nr:hypothetical protein [Halovenus rubra]